MKRICAVSGISFEISDDDIEFYRTLDIPPPTLCPQERQRRRITFRNFKSLYHRKCDLTGKKLISMYDTDVTFPVYDNSVWWADNWNAQKYGREFDFSRTFFEQYKELASEVPRFAIMNFKTENCEYANLALESKNCYLVFGCVGNEDCFYGHIVWNSKNCVDNLYIFRCEWCSNCIDAIDCYDVHFSTECANCSECFFLYDCRNCKNCFGCTNGRNLQYCFFNEQLTREEYTQKLKEFIPLTRMTIEKATAWLEEEKRYRVVYPASYGLKNEDVTGNHIYESKNLEYCFDAKQCEESKYCFTVLQTEHSYDMSFVGGAARFCYECLTVHSENTLFSHIVINSSDTAYSEFCYSSHDLFGCNGIRNGTYCILNKQYSKDEYFALRKRIIEHMKNTGEWGEFFPITMSPFAYNESIVQEYFPLSREEVLKMGLRWKEEKEVLKPAEIYHVPESIESVGDDILYAILSCSQTGKGYRVIKQELDFYRRMQLPIPLLCPDERHHQRMLMRHARELWERKCAKCGVAIYTSMPKEHEASVFCEDCYVAAVNR